MILIIGKGIGGDCDFQRWLRSDFPLCHSSNIKSNWQPLASTISCEVYMIRRKSCASNYFEFGPTKGRSVFFSKLQAKISKRSFYLCSCWSLRLFCCLQIPTQTFRKIARSKGSRSWNIAFQPCHGETLMPLMP